MKNNKIISLLTVILIVSLTLVSCSNNSEAPDGMKELSTDNNAYNFYVYTQWIVDEQNTQCAYYSAVDRSNVSMSAYVPDESFKTMQEYFDACVEQYKKDLSSYTEIEKSNDAKMFEYNAFKLVYTFEFGGQQFKVMQVMTLHQGIVYVYSYTSSPENYDLHLKDAEAMLAEITFEA